MTNLIFNKWESKASINDPGIKDYINLNTRVVMHNQGRHATKKFGKKQLQTLM